MSTHSQQSDETSQPSISLLLITHSLAAQTTQPRTMHQNSRSLHPQTKPHRSTNSKSSTVMHVWTATLTVGLHLPRQ